ncbi:MAG: ATP-binding protein [Pseudomonadota bacterium]
MTGLAPSLLAARRRSALWRRLQHWARRVDLAAKLELAFALLSVVMGVTAYTLLSQTNDPLRATIQPSVTLIATLTLIPILGLAALIARRLATLWADRRRGSAGSRLHGRVVLLFSLIAIVPTLLVGIASSLLFEFGLQVWFSDRVRTVLDNAETVAQAYVEEHRKFIRADVEAMARDLNSQPFLEQNIPLLRDYVFNQALTRDLSEAIVFDSNMRVLARADLGVSVGTKGLEKSDFQRAVSGEIVIMTQPEEEPDRVRALVKLDKYFDAYLYVSRLVDARVLQHYLSTQTAVSEYQRLEEERSATQIRFNLILMLVSLAILLAAILTGLWFATRLIAPISALAKAAERVGKGDLKARVPVRGAMDEIAMLARAFNRMTAQLMSQTGALVAANEQLEQRRRFTETVVEGVSAGVLGLDAEGRITLANRSAAELLGVAPETLVGRGLAVALPEMAPLLSAVRDGEDRYGEARINLLRDGAVQNLAVQLSAEMDGKDAVGFVATFDDITEQLADQRRAAWADVARRIAHEIKNPLTPIQLSAERLKRKYGAEVRSDPQVFEQCTDTIIRQVSDLRRIVDEFSSFARTPAPILHAEDLVDVVRQAIFLQEVAHPEIRFTLDAPAQGLVLACDRRLIAQALTNLLKNAVESIAQSQDDARGIGHPLIAGAIAITLLRSHDAILIRVADNGRGLPPELGARLFEPYVTTRAKGTGLGLAIVKKIVEDHGGELKLVDGEDGGAVAIMRFDPELLARRLAEKHGTREPAAGAPPLRGETIEIG